VRTHEGAGADAGASSIYTEFVTGFKELYDVQADPWQMSNTYKQAGEQRQKELAAQLQGLRNCGGASCGRSQYPADLEAMVLQAMAAEAREAEIASRL